MRAAHVKGGGMLSSGEVRDTPPKPSSADIPCNDKPMLLSESTGLATGHATRRSRPSEHLSDVFPGSSREGDEVLHIHQQLQRFERLTRTAATEHASRSELNHLLEHAKRHAPFWTERLAKWNPREQPLAQILDQVRPLARKELQSEFDRLSAKFPKREALGVALGSSSGSTGTPVRFERCTKLYLAQYHAVGLLCSRWHEIDAQNRSASSAHDARTRRRHHSGNSLPMAWPGRRGLRGAARKGARFPTRRILRENEKPTYSKPGHHSPDLAGALCPGSRPERLAAGLALTWGQSSPGQSVESCERGWAARNHRPLLVRKSRLHRHSVSEAQPHARHQHRV